MANVKRLFQCVGTRHATTLPTPAFEPLEPRVLLSADGLSAVGVAAVGAGVYESGPLADPAVVYVDDDGVNDPGPENPAVSDPLENGSQEHPFDRVQEGIDAVAVGGQVHVADGTYGEAVTIAKNLTLYGGYNGADWGQSRDPSLYTTTLDASGLNQSVVSILNADVTVDGFTITHGNASAGGGLYCDGGSHTIKACQIVDNKTWNGGPAQWGGAGGGLYSSETSALLLEDCTIASNQTGNGGDGLWNAAPGHGGSGAGVYCCSAVIKNCTISENSTGRGGHGVAGSEDVGNYGGFGAGVFSAIDLLVEGCTITGNRTGNGGNGMDAGGTGGHGGGIYSSGASLAVADSKISENGTGDGGDGGSAGESIETSPWGFGGYGGGVFSARGSTEIVRSRIEGNTTGSGGETWQDAERCGAGGNGAGICVLSSNLTIVDCFVGWNTAGNGASKATGNGGGGNGGEGGGIYGELSSINMAACHLLGNTTGDGGKGLYQAWIGLRMNGGGDGGRGGGICAMSSFVEISDSEFVINGTGSGGGGDLPSDDAGAGGDGGAIYGLSSTIRIDGAGFSGNHTGSGGTVNPEGDYRGRGGRGGNGGAICLQAESAGEIAQCAFEGNHTGAGGGARYDVEGGTGGLGGAVYSESSSLTTQLSSFANNTTGDGGKGGATGGSGGGLYALSSFVALTDCEFTYNLTGRAGYYRYASPSGYGGAACFLDSVVSVTGCLIQRNKTGDGIPAARGNGRSGQGGGLFFDGCSSADVYNCIVAENGTGDLEGTGGEYLNRTGDGGGLAILHSSSRVENCLIYGNFTGDGKDMDVYANSSGNGGGIYSVNNTDTAIVGCTIVGNRCGLGGTSEHLDVKGLGGGIYADAATILANTILWANLQGDVVGLDPANASYCDIMDWTFDGVNHNISKNPRFVNMADNNYRLRPDSPCIDQGHNGVVSPEGMFDLDDNPRILGSAVDLGAYEHSVDSVSPPNVGGLTATGETLHVDLSWTNPSDADFTGVKILRKTGGYSTNPLDGKVVYDGSGTACVDWAVTGGTVYYYTAFSYDETLNYSTGVTASAMPGEYGQHLEIGYRTVFSNISAVSNRRAMPVVASQDGALASISIYHQGGTGHAILAVYDDAAGRPGARLGATESTLIDNVEGWQTISLQSPVVVSAGQTIWLAWVFENDPGMRWTAGAPGRAISTATWSGGMPDNFGGSTTYDGIYSIYATYGTQTDTTPPGTVGDLTATAGEGQVALSWTNPSNADFAGVKILRKEGTYPAHPTDGVVAYIGSATSYLDSGLTNGTTYYYTVFSYDEVPNYSAGATVAGTPVAEVAETVGYTTVFSNTSMVANRRAVPVVLSKTGTIESISIYHQGGTGHAILAVYDDAAGRPGTRLGVTNSTLINSAEGWQTIALQSSVAVSEGQTIWLAWVFENDPGMRWAPGTPGRAISTATWSGGMPYNFGSSLTEANAIYSIYAAYADS